MNSTDFHKESSSLQLLGKEFIIVVVVIFSALSFTLGYFVGKSGIDKKPATLSQTSGITPGPQKLEPQTSPAMPVAENTPQTEVTAKEVVQTQPKEPFVIVESKQPESLKNTRTAKEKTRGLSASEQKPTVGRTESPTVGRTEPPTVGRTEAPTVGRPKVGAQASEPPTVGRTEAPTVGRPKVGAQASEPPTVGRTEAPKETSQKPAVKDSPISAESKKTDEPLYAIQLGAFKNSAEAETFRKKHTKKGLKTYIITSTNSKKEKIYKVTTGEFKDRKKAEVMSLKLNKTEKLKTFVTLKNE